MVFNKLSKVIEKDASILIILIKNQTAFPLIISIHTNS